MKKRLLSSWCSSAGNGARHPKYGHVFEPLVLPSGLELRNRIVMGSMHTGLEEKIGKSGGLDEMAAFYGERAAGGVGLIVTGGVAPNREGWVLPLAGKLTTKSEASHHRVVTRAVRENGGKIAMQILHAGRYAYHPWAVGPSKKKAPINVFTPRALTAKDVARTVDDFAKASELAREAGYEGVEIMGSEGYLINQFLAPRTNDRDDKYGEDRSLLAREIAAAVRRAAGKENFALIFRLSLVELVENGMSFEEAVDVAFALKDAGVDVINTGIGWHEARVPTIATRVPRAAFTFATKMLKDKLGGDEGDLALCATNRINDIGVAEGVLKAKEADLVSMARPFLADSHIVAKAFEEREAETNTCIACNQACLDHTFKLVPVSCLVNPRAGHETSLNLVPASIKLDVAVVGAGMAGLSCATALKERGHRVTLFEASEKIGGQFNLAAKVPGKEEFEETIRYFRKVIDGVDLKLSTSPTTDDLMTFDKVVVATGVVPREVKLPVIGDPSSLPRVRSYAEVLANQDDKCGSRVAVVGAGGIGFDVADFLTHDSKLSFYDEWGIDTTLRNRGALKEPTNSQIRDVYLLQRKSTPHGAGLAKTTGWIHRLGLKKRKVNMLGGCEYLGLVEQGLRIKRDGVVEDLLVDDVVLCAGQTSVNSLYESLKAKQHQGAFIIGGAEKASELDAKRAIDQGYRLAANIDDAKSGEVFQMPTGWKASALDFMQNAFASPKKKRISKQARS